MRKVDKTYICKLSQARVQLCRLFKEVSTGKVEMTIISRGKRAQLLSFREYNRLKSIEKQWLNLSTVLNLLPGEADDYQL